MIVLPAPHGSGAATQADRQRLARGVAGEVLDWMTAVDQRHLQPAATIDRHQERGRRQSLAEQGPQPVMPEQFVGQAGLVSD
jgi:hypothetical protein